MGLLSERHRVRLLAAKQGAWGAELDSFGTSGSVAVVYFFGIAVCAVGIWLALLGALPPWGLAVIGAAEFTLMLGAFSLSASSVTCYDNGFFYRSTSASTFVPWDGVEAITLSASRPVRQALGYASLTTYRVAVTIRDGRHLRCGSRFDEGDRLGLYLINATKERLLTRARSEYEAGKTVDFGYVRLNRDAGLRLTPLWRRPETIPLNQLTDYQVKRGDIRFWRRRQVSPITVPFDRVSNALVLLEMLDTLTSKTRAATLNLANIVE